MAAVLSATHLLRRFTLFALTVLFLLTLGRAGYALWHYEALDGRESAVRLFVQGLRVDLGLIGLLLLPVVLLAPLLGLMRGTRAIARVLTAVLLTVFLLAVLLAEYITPGVLLAQGVRPDVQVLASLEDAPGFILAGLRAAPLPALLGALLIALIIIAFIARLDARRLMAYPLAAGSGVFLSLAGGALCLLAVWSAAGVSAPMAKGGAASGAVTAMQAGVDAAAGGESGAGNSGAIEADAATSSLLDELALNTVWKLLYPPVVEPVMSLLSSDPGR